MAGNKDWNGNQASIWKTLGASNHTDKERQLKNGDFTRWKRNPNGLLEFLQENFTDMKWDFCKRYEDRFIISSNGYVISLRTYKRMKITILPNGYYYLPIIMQKPKRRTITAYLHRLVAETFIENELNKTQVNHKDGDKSNNDISNLEWCTQSENNYHAIRKLGIKRNTSKIMLINKEHRLFTDEQVRIIRREKLSVKQVFQRWGIYSGVIYDIRKYKTYKDVL